MVSCCQKEGIPVKALIVDDDQFVRKCIQNMISWKAIGFDQTLEAENGAAAYQLALEKNPDLIITDIKMPIMDGLELVEKLRGAVLDVDIIVLSAYNDFEYARKAMRFGVRDFVLKPLNRININQLQQIILELKEKRSKKNTYRQLMLNREALEQILEFSFQEKNTRVVRDFFKNEVFPSRLRLEDAVDCSLLLQDVLFRFLEKKHISAEQLYPAREQAVNKIRSIRNPESLFDYIHYLWVSHLDAIYEKESASQLYQSYYQEIVRYISEHLGDFDLSVKKVSDYLHLSSVYVGTIFKQISKVTLSSYINQARIEKAMSLLRDTRFSISEISSMTGYDNREYFSRTFRKYVGITPSEYKSMVVRTQSEVE